MTLEAEAPPKRERRLPWFMRGNYAPVPDEIESFTLKVTGEIPAHLDGVYMRNGPNPLREIPGHWFGGDGMLHGVRLSGGKAVWYRNRFVQTKALKGEKFMLADFSMDRSVGVANTHVVPHGGKIYALVESSFPTRVDAELNTIGIDTFGGGLDYSFTAHPKIDAETGEMHAFGYGFTAPFVVYHRIGADGRYLQREEIAVAGATMVHDFAMTKNHVVFMDLPVCFEIEAAMKGGMPYQWSDAYRPRLGILKKGRPAAETRWVDVAPGYVFHVANAFERADGTIVLDVARLPELWRAGTKKNFDPAHLHRWTIAPGASMAADMPLDERCIEFPRIDDRLAGLENRYAYAVATAGGPEEKEEFSQLLKFDLQAGTRVDKDFGRANMTGEFTFVARPGQRAEDDGWLMAFVYDSARDGSDLVILDAQTLDEAARVEMPRRVPAGFHGNWVPA